MPTLTVSKSLTRSAGPDTPSPAQDGFDRRLGLLDCLHVTCGTWVTAFVADGTADA